MIYGLLSLIAANGAGVGSDRAFQQPVEQQITREVGAPVEPEHELVE